MTGLVILAVLILCVGWILWRRRRCTRADTTAGPPGGMPHEPLVLDALARGNSYLGEGKFDATMAASPQARALEPKHPHVAGRLAAVERRPSRSACDTARPGHTLSGGTVASTKGQRLQWLLSLPNRLRHVRIGARAVPALDAPIRAELFSSERLEQHAESLAAAQHVMTTPRRGRRLLPRVLDNGRVLLASYRVIAKASREEPAITPAAEWLVDNFHVVDDQLREIRDDLPPGFYRQLPQLAAGPLQGYPRVFGLAWAFVAHTDGQFDPETLRRFVHAYQRVQPLTIGELWAVAITVRVVLVENLRRLAERIVHERAARQEADALADGLCGLDSRAGASATMALRRFEGAPLTTAFAVQLVQRLRDRDPVSTPALRWLEERLTAQGTTADALVQGEHQQQAATHVTVRNVITSMRLMSAFDWQAFFESVSLVDRLLWADPRGAAPDFATRDHYRHAIEELARGSPHTELDITRRAIQRAQHSSGAAQDPGAIPADRRRDPGYYLVAEGRLAFEQELDFRVPIKCWLRRAYLTQAVPRYLGTIALVSGLILAAFLWTAGAAAGGTMGLLLLGLLGLVPAFDLAIALVNRSVVALLGPQALPRLALRDGVPSELRTLVVVPTLLTGQAQIARQIERLEVHYLANAEGDLRFVLLSDWADAPRETMPEDDALLAATVEGIAQLNRCHGPASDGGTRFLLLHRRRGWNDSAQQWIGWERKRGKLHELNRLLRGATDTTFVSTGGQAPFVPSGVRFVITLDADTRLPMGAACRLIGTLAHPLNRPRFDPAVGRVVEGYGVLQPRVTPTIPTAREGSLFQRLFSGLCGMDPYASAISDVYQDLFGEGSYTGKGIYDVDAFEAALAGRVPENTLLSHDLFEGIFARAGLVTDIECFEEFPSHYEVAAARQHRWARGDWQLLPWITGHTPDRSGSRRYTAMSLISRWKMLDNLRRTLSAPTAVLTLFAGWTLPLVSPVRCTMFVLATMALPALLPFLTALIPHRRGIAKRSHARAVITDLGYATSHVALAVTLLAHQAWLMTDAIVRTLSRVYVTRRNLLEWVTAAQATSGADLTLSSVYRRMGGAVVLAAGGLLVALSRPGAWPVAGPCALLWALSPIVARWLSRPPRAAGALPLTVGDACTLRVTARRTWRFFETFVGPEDHALPPDNFQEEPRPVVAHRTSPTNLGLYLLSVIAAHDFGWLGTLAAGERLEATLGTMTDLAQFRGHFYNWYDTRDLRPLDPLYVSSVDSGNLAGHLIALGQACQDILKRPLLGPQVLSGIADTVRLVRASAGALTDDRRTHIVTRTHLDEALDALTLTLSPVPVTPGEWLWRFRELEAQAHIVVDIARTLTAERDDRAAAEVLAWAEAVQADIASHARDLSMALPWARLVCEDTLSSRAPLPEQRSAWTTIAPYFATLPTLADTPARCATAIDALTTLRRRLVTEGVSSAVLAHIDAIIENLTRAAAASEALGRRLMRLAQLTQTMFDAMEFNFLFDPTRKLFSIGYRVTDNSLDPGYYDLLASEARLTSFIAIAKGEVPASHWFTLGRALTPVGWGSALVSWSGSMFEYLMPALVMRSPAGSLLEQTYHLVIRRQRHYGAERGVPWGISESAYNARDLELTYQYTNFGVPGLGLKRGLSEDVVVAPYATALAAMITPGAAARNVVRLIEAGAHGRYGLYEALDYTATRLPQDTRVAVVRAYMAHHQGMTLVALVNVLHDGVMRTRFHAEPRIQATELLLQERTPRNVLITRPRVEEVQAVANVRDLVPPVLRRFTSPHAPTPGTHLLSNGRYVVMVTAAGSGYSRCRDLAVTRWREDRTRDAWGTYVFLRDVHSGAVWSAAYQPSGVEPDMYEGVFAEDHVEIRRRDGNIATTLEVVVSPEHDAEVRRVTLTNLGPQSRDIELTSYAEIVLAPPATDLAHPAFSNLFVQTEYAPECGALLATRRPRSHDEPQVWMAHVGGATGDTVGAVQYETDRARFLGRGHGIRAPLSVIDGHPLSNTVGAVLDPIVSLRRCVHLAPGATARVTFATLVAPSRHAALALADEYRNPAMFERTATLAWTQAQVQLHHLGMDRDEASLFQELASRLLYSDPTLRPSSAVLARNTRGPSALWRYGISGDLPIVLVRIDAFEGQGLIRQLLRAHEYWQMKQLVVDLVILNEQASSYAQQDLQTALETQVRTSQSHARHEGHVPHSRLFILRADLVSADDRLLLQTAARVVLVSRDGTLAEQLERRQRAQAAPTSLPSRLSAPPGHVVPPPRPDLEFFNGLGGFDAHGREYVTILGQGQWTPAPWINVIANPTFGFQVSESGSGYTWSLNSRENQLTPWSNDPVSDPSGETIYVRDEDSGELWGPTVLPLRQEAWPYIARHGQGYSRFEHTAHGIALALLQFVPLQDPVKLSRLTLENHSSRPRRLSVTAYVEWVLGASRSAAAPCVVTEIDAATGAMLARNPWNSEVAGGVAFADLGGRQTACTGDRTEFLGRNGTLDHPAALARGERLSGRVGAGLDPCGALQTTVELRAGSRAEIVFVLGQAASTDEARTLIARYRTADLDVALRTVVEHWDDVLGAVQVTTPDRAMNVLLNRWLLYQTLACRVWARGGFYQAGGAYGFRDQLQDVMALTVAQRDVARAQILRAAARQFVEGDVQHWWHPPAGRGVRTRIADDLLWLPYVVSHYLDVTGEGELLDAVVPFLDGPTLAAGQDEAYVEPQVSAQHGTLFEHCARALDRSLAVGSHGLPLIGTGDWNDGMNRVGHAGQGESVWLGWFLHTILWDWARLAEARGERQRAERWRLHVSALKAALEREAWDGAWYRRAYFDDGTPLGSTTNAECRIDAIAQSWGVLSGAADPARGARAMAAVEDHLVRRRDGLVLLFTPPFDRGSLDPGYIKGYLPGVRENGGQYTHAAIWSVLAFAALGDGDTAGELFALLNPINHASTRAGVYRYKVEPYVMAADLYAEAPHVGRGGWTWYTGSAGWMYRAGLEWLLGFRLRGTMLHLDPCIPRAWQRFTITFRYHSSCYEIVVENPHGVARGVATVALDGAPLAGGNAPIPLADDGVAHQVCVALGPAPLPAPGGGVM
ncbi:MAG: glucoamylase family protein [Candidatus Tectimicrobiota bacterium]